MLFQRGYEVRRASGGILSTLGYSQCCSDELHEIHVPSECCVPGHCPYNLVRQVITFSNYSNIVVLCQNSLSMEYQNWNSPSAFSPHDAWMIFRAYHLLKDDAVSSRSRATTTGISFRLCHAVSRRGPQRPFLANSLDQTIWVAQIPVSSSHRSGRAGGDSERSAPNSLPQ